jgi:glycosyltransferase involved in cell wall biosynthesis
VAHEKNIDFLLRMFVQLRAQRPDALFVIAGEGPAREHLARLSRSLGVEDAVRFIGYLDRASELPDCYAAGDAFVFASRTETQGLVLLEAHGTGNTRGVHGRARHPFHSHAGCGAFVVAEDEGEFASAVAQALSLSKTDRAPRTAARACRIMGFAGHGTPPDHVL